MENGLPQEKSGYAGDVYLLFQRLATRQLDVVLSAFFSMQHVAFPRGPEGLFFACKSMSLADVPTVKTLGSLGGSASHGEVQHQFSEHITGRPTHGPAWAWDGRPSKPGELPNCPVFSDPFGVRTCLFAVSG